MRKIILTIALFLVSCTGNNSLHAVKQWTTVNSLKTPESVNYAPDINRLYVSCINTSDVDRDSNGFIAIVTLDGVIENLEWATGLDAPKGAAISGDKLYVSDIDRLVEIDRTTGSVIRRITAPNARFLNDVAVSPSGTIYVSDSSEENSAVYVLNNDSLTIWLSHPDVSMPNGLFAGENQLFIGNGGDTSIKAADYITGAVSTIVNTGSKIDGLAMMDENTFIVSDWQGKTGVIRPNEPLQVFLNTTDEKINAADFAYIPDRHLLFIPTFFDNRVTAYLLEK